MAWEVIWALPNIELDEPLESCTYALVPPTDQRIRILVRQHPNFRTFLRRFRDTHKEHLSPTIIIRRVDIPDHLKAGDVAASFRDLIVASTVPLARSWDIVHDNSLDRVRYSSFFWIHPWMLDNNYEHMIAHTPALLGIHSIDRFMGHSSPELSPLRLRRGHFDEPLLQELLQRWMARYDTNAPKWADVALFRSLNMINQACLIPAGQDVVIHDYGRMAALWVAAFEILVHPGGNGRANLERVFGLLQSIPWIDEACGHRRYLIARRRTNERRNLACWLYHKIYDCRNNFFHGNPVTLNDLKLPISNRFLTSHAATLYRLALTAFLELQFREPLPTNNDTEELGAYTARLWAFESPQETCEEALRLCRVSISEQRRNRENNLGRIAARAR